MKLYAYILLSLFSLSAFVGTWKTQDEDAEKPSAIVEISDKVGNLVGKVIDVINPTRPHPVCIE